MGKPHVEALCAVDVVCAAADRNHRIHSLRREAQRAEIGGETSKEAGSLPSEALGVRLLV